ncbi:hypothetical protein ANN_14355 [Periplaneta americana]|uniref:Uncharacterized protein n=1 Tax=Periplaneta americana TaxID=6978 RepID=A0ABQ8SXI0_PERAM|nr:hypothetical protein ANN_14355 [Periplaneta americana]
MASKIHRPQRLRLLPLGYLKSRVYQDRPRTIQDLKRNIRTEVAAISPNVFQRVMRSLPLRLQECADNDGHHLRNTIFKKFTLGKARGAASFLQRKDWENSSSFTGYFISKDVEKVFTESHSICFITLEPQPSCRDENLNLYAEIFSNRSTASATKKESPAPVHTVRTPRNIDRVSQAIVMNPCRSTRKHKAHKSQIPVNENKLNDVKSLMKFLHNDSVNYIQSLVGTSNNVNMDGDYDHEQSNAVPNNCPEYPAPAASLDLLGNVVDAVNCAEHYGKIMEVTDALDNTDSSAVAAVKSLPSEQLLKDILFIDSNLKSCPKASC